VKLACEVKPRLTPTYTASGLISPQAVPGLVITRKFFVRPPLDPNCATSVTILLKRRLGKPGEIIASLF
jgi:hypothetical protein